MAENLGRPEMYDYMLRLYRDGDNAFKCAIEKYHLPVTIEQLLEIYRTHKPHIALDDAARTTLATLMSRSIVLGLNEDILVSEEFGCGKPDERCYRYFMDKRPNARHYYVGDNLSKDFVMANKLGWTTMCLLDDGRNIFKQDFTIETQYLPKYKINTLKEILNLI